MTDVAPPRASAAEAPQTAARAIRSRARLLDALTRDHILEGVRLFNAGHPHDFGPSTFYDLIHEGRPYPPKAVVGLACLPALGEVFVPDDFSGGLNSKCFAVLERNGFTVVPKSSAFPPTADPLALDTMTRELLQAPVLPKPSGQRTPKKVERTVTEYERDPLVVAFVLRRAAGKCECCGNPAPFLDKDGEPFLEVHHVVPLCEDGEDTVENAAAICPNCHRECHHGKDAETLRVRLLQVARSIGVATSS